MAYVIQLEPGGSSAIVAAKLSIAQANEMATHLKEIGDPPGCCWCVGYGTRKKPTRKRPPILGGFYPNFYSLKYEARCPHMVMWENGEG